MSPNFSFLLVFVSSIFFHPNLSDFSGTKGSGSAKAPNARFSIYPGLRADAGSSDRLVVTKVRYGGLSRVAFRSDKGIEAGLSASSISSSVSEVDGPRVTGAVHPMLKTEVQVVAMPTTLDSGEGFQRPITPREVETSAGTFGDVSRFLQTVAGVVSDNDQRNDVLVRGGNPSENLFVIDNIEIPSINQLALSDTTGGFVSMLDANAIQQITLHTDAYDSRFEQRLSSVVEVSTRPAGPTGRHSTSEAGIAGVGGSMTRPLGRDGSLFVSGRQSVMQYLTNDIGMNGVPHYRNAFVRAENRMGERDSWWGISLTGIDSMKIQPSATDGAETNLYDIDYSGWRNTTGLNWQHVYSAKLVTVASVAHAEQSQTVLETAQLENNAAVYNEKTSDGISTVKYDLTYQAGSKVIVTAGVRTALDQVNYAVAQPIGLQNPYSNDPAAGDATAFGRKFATFSSSGYVQAAISLPHGAELVVGERGMEWALGGHKGATSKALFSVPVMHRLFHVGYAELEQMPSTLYLLSFNNLRTLEPIKSRQLTAGVVLADTRRTRVTLETYNKTYLSYPVATNYPQLSLANISDTFGQAFLMFPMVAKGQGLSRGVELTVQDHVSSRLNVTATVAYSRSLYTGLDGIWRRGNFDLPLVANVTGVWSVGRGFTFSWRDSVTSGKPYTPDNMALSLAQNRDVYDLTRINGVRSSAYERLDLRLEQARKIGLGVLNWHVGLENALNRKNFYSYAWQPRAGDAGVAEQDQMPLFPDGGLKYSF
jgi:hypothetical protein